MYLKGYFYLIWRSIRRNPGRTLLNVFGGVVGTFFLCLALSGYFGVRGPLLEELGRAFPEKRLVVKPKTLEISLVKINRTKLTSAIIEKIRKLRGVDAVYPIQPIWFPVRAEGRIFGVDISTDIAVNGVSPALVMDSVAPGEDFGGYYTTEKPAPVIISRYFLDLYNFGVAQSNNLPKFNESSAIGKEFDLILGESTISGLVESEKSRRIRCKVVGFTPDVSLFGLVMPLDMVKQFNTWYLGDVVRDYVLAQVELSDVNDAERVSGALKGMGLVVESHKGTLEQFRFALNLISAAVFIFAGCVLILVAVSFAHSESLTMIERREEVGLLRAIGAGRSDVMRLIVGEKILVGFVAGATGVGLLGVIWYVMHKLLGNIAVNVPLIGNSFGKMAMPLWVPVVGILFSAFFGAIICGIILRRALQIPPARLMKNI